MYVCMYVCMYMHDTAVSECTHMHIHMHI
jgi:hypothetical protein